MLESFNCLFGSAAVWFTNHLAADSIQFENQIENQIEIEIEFDINWIQFNYDILFLCRRTVDVFVFDSVCILVSLWHWKFHKTSFPVFVFAINYQQWNANIKFEITPEKLMAINTICRTTWLLLQLSIEYP